MLGLLYEIPNTRLAMGCSTSLKYSDGRLSGSAVLVCPTLTPNIVRILTFVKSNVVNSSNYVLHSFSFTSIPHYKAP
jgi:hypothetical protein